MKKSSNISVTALHRFIPQPASGRSSALPCLDCIFSMVRILAIIAFTRLFFHTHKTQLYPILLKLNFPTLRLASEFESIIRQLLKLSHYIVHGKLRIPYVFLNTSCPHGTDSLLTVYILGCILDSLKTFFIPPFSVSYYIILVHFFIIYPPDCF